MAAAMDNLRDSWERRNPSEQRLIVIAGLVFAALIVYVMVSKVTSGMAEIEAQNEESRKALYTLSLYRNAKAKAKAAGDVGSTVAIPDTAIALDTYLNDILKEMEITSPTFPELRENPLGEFVELSFSIDLKGLAIGDVSEFLERVETGSQLVVVKELNIDRSFRDKEKLDLELTVATYKKKEKEKKKAKKDGEDDSEEEG